MKQKLIKRDGDKKQTIVPLIVAIDKWIIALLMFYVFMYQYVFGSISFVLPLLGLGIMACGLYFVLEDHSLIRKSSYTGILLCIVLIEFFSMTLSESGGFVNPMGNKIVQYVLTGFAIYIFLMVDKSNLTFFYTVTVIAITLLALANYLIGTVRITGAVGIEGLNTNLMSSMYLMGVYSAAMLLYRKCLLPKKMIYGCVLIIIVSQIVCASRRGFIVLGVFLILFAIYVRYFAKNDSMSLKSIIQFLVLCTAIFIILFILLYYVMNYTVLGQRLAGEFDGGDDKRRLFKELAYQLFLQHPVFGVGINCFSAVNPYHMYTHSFYYELLVSSGIVGTTAFTIYGALTVRKAFGLSCRRIYEEYEISRKEQSLSKINLIFIFCIILTGFAVVMWYDLYFYLWLAMIGASNDSIQRKIDNCEKSRYVEASSGLIRRFVKVEGKV